MLLTSFALTIAIMTPQKTAPEPAVWISHSLKRYFPASLAEKQTELTLEVARGERASCQVVVRTGEEYEDLKVDAKTIPGINVQVRRVGYVTLKHFNTRTQQKELDGVGFLPGLAPDPLFPENEHGAGPLETNAFWLTLHISKDAKPGSVRLPIIVNLGAAKHEVHLNLNVHQALLPPRTDFPVTQWFYADALCDWYKLKPYEEALWPLLRKYMEDILEHGQDCMHVPVFTPPTDGVKRPTQLIRVTRREGKYVFDWTDVKRYIRLAKEVGFKRFEWAHFFAQWGCKYATRIYEGDQAEEKLLWPADTAATSPVYRDFLSQFLPELMRFLDEEGIREGSLFHISDEPHGDEPMANYKKAKEMMNELAPQMKFMDALSDIEFARKGLVDVPIPSISTAIDFVKAGYYSWAYYCGGPRGEYLQRLIDTPLPKIRMNGWLLYKHGAKGFLHWGYNYWHVSQTRTLLNPFEEQSGDAWPDWAYGDTFVVYPGKDGPIDSIRWEVFADSLQDLALLQAIGVNRSDKALASLRSYAKFPKSADWILKARKEMLDRLDEKQAAGR